MERRPQHITIVGFVWCTLCFCSLTVFPSSVGAQTTTTEVLPTGDVGFLDSTVRMVPEKFFAGDLVKFYVTLHSFGTVDVEGSVRLYVNGEKIGDDKLFSSRAGGANEEVWFYWRATEGDDKVEFNIVSDQESAGRQENNVILKKITVEKDTDRDGIADSLDPDKDNDGLPNEWEVRYGFDPLNSADALKDTDGDTLTNLEEFKRGTDPTKADTDGDGLNDSVDAFPLDRTRPPQPKPVPPPEVLHVPAPSASISAKTLPENTVVAKPTNTASASIEHQLNTITTASSDAPASPAGIAVNTNVGVTTDATRGDSGTTSSSSSVQESEAQPVITPSLVLPQLVPSSASSSEMAAAVSRSDAVSGDTAPSSETVVMTVSSSDEVSTVAALSDSVQRSNNASADQSFSMLRGWLGSLWLWIIGTGLLLLLLLLLIAVAIWHMSRPSSQQIEKK